MDRISIGELMRTLGEQDRALAAHLTEQGIPSEGKEGLIALVEKVGKLNFLPILFYDWDGVTLLGVGKARKADAPAEQQALVNEAMRDFAISQMSAEDGAAYQAAGFDPANGTAHPAEGKPLSNKPGYTFGKWIPLETEYGSSYGGAANVKNVSGDYVVIPEPDGYVFTEADRAGGIKVKAAYRTNADMEQTLASWSNVVNRNYTIAVTGSMSVASSGVYAVTFTVERKNPSGMLVPRARELGLRIDKTVDTGNDTTVSLKDLMELENQDKVEVVAMVDGGIKTLFVEVIDLCDDPNLGGVENWVSLAGCLGAITVNAVGEAHDGYVEIAALNYINGELRANNGLGGMNPMLNYAGLDYSAPLYGLASGTPIKRRRQAGTNLIAMYDSLPEDKKAAGLTWDEMQEAIKNGTVWDATLNDGAGGWTNGFTGTYVPPEPTTTE